MSLLLLKEKCIAFGIQTGLNVPHPHVQPNAVVNTPSYSGDHQLEYHQLISKVSIVCFAPFCVCHNYIDFPVDHNSTLPINSILKLSIKSVSLLKFYILPLFLSFITIIRRL
jgi:hypothetical protein